MFSNVQVSNGKKLNGLVLPNVGCVFWGGRTLLFSAHKGDRDSWCVGGSFRLLPFRLPLLSTDSSIPWTGHHRRLTDGHQDRSHQDRSVDSTSLISRSTPPTRRHLAAIDVSFARAERSIGQGSDALGSISGDSAGSWGKDREGANSASAKQAT